MDRTTQAGETKETPAEKAAMAAASRVKTMWAVDTEVLLLGRRRRARRAGCREVFCVLTERGDRR
ncbi:hypothetical protein GCM10023317_86630 [Actinopolymorpha pittospori]